MSKDLLVTAENLRNLPAPVQRYMAYTGVLGKAWIQTVRVVQAGRFRRGPDQPWMAMSAEQRYTTDPPGFVWKARFKMWGLPLMSARDTYRDGHGHMYGKLAGLFTLFDARGEKLDQGAMVRYLSEIPWFPIAFLGENITWQAVDDHSADVTFTDTGKSVTGRMFFDDEGRPTDFVAMRYREINGDFSLDRWTAPVTGYGVRAGLNLPVRGQVIWKLPEGDLQYWDGEITEIEYNV